MLQNRLRPNLHDLSRLFCKFCKHLRKISDMSAPRKEFVLKHVFKDVRNLKENEYQRGPTEEHFNVSW